ncbi:hypothetical protein MACK_002689 [Theileria orientalis]|uniref:Uncharacterized protein n=1 Tax=Theileria orientalis TaxID=68886 RepID=A0A976MDE2_THEOR|nr:hypothetical protein MACK_002689 [Theileria orientalis]
MGISTSDWEKKWRLMIDKDNNRKIQNEILSEKLQKKKEFEESIECTFQPNLSKIYGPGYTFKRSKDELMQLLIPIINEEESILMVLSRIELDEENNRKELRDLIISSFHKFPGKSTDYFLNFYRDERLNDVCKSKNLKLEVVGKLQELERKFNILCSTESISSSELKRVGFDIENCKNIKKELLSSIDNHETLKNRYRASREFDEIMKNIERQRRYEQHQINQGKTQHNDQSDNNTNQHFNQKVNKINYSDMDNKSQCDFYYGGNNSQNYSNIDNHYNNKISNDQYYKKLDTNKYNYGSGQYYSPQMSYQNPYYNQSRSSMPSYQLLDKLLDTNQLNNQRINGYQMTNQSPSYNQMINQFNNQQPIRSPQISHTTQQPIQHTYGLNRPGYPGIPYSNNPLMANSNYLNGNLNNYRPFPLIENANPFVK